jgi:hypothetical protein
MIKILPQNFTKLVVKFGSKAEISWKFEELKWILLDNSEVSSNLLGHILLFWKVTMQAFQKYPNFQEILDLEKNLVEGRCVREVSREFGPWFFLVPPILVKLVFLGSVRTQLTVGRRVEINRRSDSSKLCFRVFYSIVNIPTKRKS